MKIHGIIPPPVTPLKADESLDLEAAGKLIEHVIAGGVHGLFILGKHGSSIIKGIKGALEVRGICRRYLASPF